MEHKQAITDAVDGARDRLIRLSHEVHANPELCFEEVVSSGLVADALEEAGFAVERGICDLETAFSATSGGGDLEIAICAEYDALPGIGHACGHNIIASAAVGAAIGLKPVADDLGITIRVLGTPAEEGGGGKIFMLERGGFDGVHAAMMVHPAPFESDTMPCLAVQPLHVRYKGKSAHASAFPELGLNAADALTVAQVAIGLLRQHITSSDRIHGIVTDGGDAPNIVPERTAGKWYVRSATLESLEMLLPRVKRCFDAGALATGTEVTIENEGPAYSEMRPDTDLMRIYVEAAESIGREFPDFGDLKDKLAGSTDMANISLEIPTIHPIVGIETDGAVNHQPEFTSACIRPSADKAVRDGALAMALAAASAATDDDVRERLVSRPYTRG